MTPDEFHAAVVAAVRRSTAAQGLPEKLEDPGTAARIAEILDPEQRLARPRARSRPAACRKATAA